MYVNEKDKYTSEAYYFYNKYIDMYCIVGTTISMEYLDDMQSLFESPDLLMEIEMPKYITENYDETEW